MSDVMGFLQAIRAQPEEDTPRLVFADWLDEQGDEANHARAEFIRVQVEAAALARLPHPDMATPAEVDDLARRAERIRHQWLPQWAGLRWAGGWPALLNDPEFTRGFVDHVMTTGNQFRAEFATAQRFEPVTAVTLKDAPDGIVAAAGCPELAGVRDLTLFVQFASFTGRDPVAGAFASLAASPHLGALTALTVLSPMNDVACRNFAAAQSAAQLRRLACVENLRFLALNDCRLSAVGGRALAESPFLGNLEELQLEGNTNLGRKTVAQLRGRFGDRVWFGPGE